jgi:hypothetical protein
MAFHLWRRQTDDTFHGWQRDRITLSSRLDQQRLRDRQCERQTHAETRTGTTGGLEIEHTAEFSNLAGDDIHAHAATRRLRHLGGGTEPRLKYQLHYLPLVHVLVRANQSGFESARPNRLGVEAGAVVGHLDDHLRTFSAQADADACALGFARGTTVRRRLYAVHDGIAQHVFERGEHSIQDLPVQLAAAAFDHQFGLLADVGAGLPDDSLQALGVLRERHHSRSHQSGLQISGGTCLLDQQVFPIPLRCQRAVPAG